MKVNIEIDCTPQEARQFMGLPDVEKANAIYMDKITDAMTGISSVEQLEQLASQVAPMGQMGLKMFQNFFESAARQAGMGGAAPKDGGGTKKGS